MYFCFLNLRRLAIFLPENNNIKSEERARQRCCSLPSTRFVTRAQQPRVRESFGTSIRDAVDSVKDHWWSKLTYFQTTDHDL